MERKFNWKAQSGQGVIRKRFISRVKRLFSPLCPVALYFINSQTHHSLKEWIGNISKFSAIFLGVHLLKIEYLMSIAAEFLFVHIGIHYI